MRAFCLKWTQKILNPWIVSTRGIRKKIVWTIMLISVMAQVITRITFQSRTQIPKLPKLSFWTVASKFLETTKWFTKLDSAMNGLTQPRDLSLHVNKKTLIIVFFKIATKFLETITCFTKQHKVIKYLVKGNVI